MTLRRFIAFAAICGLTAAACGTRATEQSAVRRGDEAFALGNYEEALSEYRLAVRQGADDAATIARSTTRARSTWRRRPKTRRLQTRRSRT